nr:unnamed protein product [Spirometra erinaceieuropaei]
MLCLSDTADVDRPTQTSNRIINNINNNDQDDSNQSLLSETQANSPTLALCPGGDDGDVSQVQLSDANKEVDRFHPEGRQYAFLLVKSLCRAFGPRLMVCWICHFIRVFTVYMSPLLLSALLRFLASESTYPNWYGYVLASGFFVGTFISSFLFNQGFYVGFSAALSAKSALMAAIYRKTLKLSSEARGDYTAGQIVNFLTVDVDRLLEVLTYIHVVWTALIQFTIAVSMLWAQLGVSMLAGLAVMMLFFPLNAIVVWLTRKFEAKEMAWKDERMKCLTETLSGIKILKLYAWEEAFEKLVTKLRNVELRQLLFGSISRGVVEANWTVAPFVVLLATFSSYIARLRPEAFINGTSTKESIPGLLTPEKIFVSLSLFNLLAVPLTSLPYMASLIVMATLAYTSQSAWIQHQSLRENILFGAPYDSTLYAAVIEACQLEEDIRHLPEGDATVVGERGLTLSGGQKQRVALARAVYQQRDIYLLDDPLAAVDVHVGQRLFERVIGPRGILRDRTRIFVTNTYQWLSSCDRVLVLDNGSVAHFGTFRGSGEYTQKTDPAQVTPEEDSACTAEFENETDFHETNLNEEEILQGRVSFKAYAVYVLARGVILTLISVISYSVFSGIMAFSNKWLQNFADDKDFTAAGKILIDPAANQSARYQAAQDVLAISHHYLSIYSWLGLVLTLFICVFVMTTVASSFKASKDLHRRMLARVLRAPCYFFDTTPQGRILNRFSFDIDNIDHNLQYSIRVVFSYVVDTVVTLLIVFITIRPWYFSLGSFVIFSALYISIQAFYLPISRQSRRLNSVTKSPLLAHCSETAASLLGASVVRAHGKVEEFVAAADRLIDNNALFFYIRSVSNRWLDFRLDMLNCLFLTFTAVLTVAMRGEMPPGMAGFLISYVLAVPESLSWLVKMTAQLESSAVAIERVKEYMEIEQEAAWASGPGSPPPPDWPSACCAVELIDATVKYMPQQREQTDDVTSAVAPESLQAREKSTALRRVNLKLSGRPDERVVGIVGRTGAGKSTLAAALFRLVEAERDCSMLEVNTDGQGADHRPGPIFIDNVDISKLGLHEVRSRFSILPQDPILFTGTLRFNLDPFGVLDDADLWRALEKAHLGDWVHSLPAGLDHHCGESGSALSAGQKQLICLARVLLSCGGRVRLLVLDEATSAMDPNTDRLVMSTLLSDVFRDATILIIAHRLSTIMTADRVIVMSHGRVVESGRPEELLQDPNSLFSGMHAHADEA